MSSLPSPQHKTSLPLHCALWSQVSRCFSLPFLICCSQCWNRVQGWKDQHVITKTVLYYNPAWKQQKMTCMDHMLVSFMHHAASLTAHASDSSVVPCSVSLLIMCQQSRPCYRGVQASFGEAQRFLTAQGINPPVLADKAGKAGSAAEGVFNQAKPSLTSSLTSLTSRDPTTLAEYALGALAFYYLVSLSRLLCFCPAYSCLTSQLSDLLNRVCHMRCLSLPSQPCSHITLQSVIHVSDL